MGPPMKARGSSTAWRRGSAWLALAMLPLLSGCLGAVALPLIAGGTLSVATRHRVRAATPVPAKAKPPALATAPAKEAQNAAQASNVTLTDLKALPAPGAAGPASDDPWQRFFAYALSQVPAKSGKASRLSSALLAPNPSLDLPQRRACPAQFAAVVIDLDDGATAFAPEHLIPAAPAIAQGLAQLRQAGVVILWISQLPASRASDVAAALRSAGLDPQGQDQLLLARSPDDRKQLLRENANEDVCIVAIAGDKRGDFDELFDYLRNPGSAAALYPMMGSGWFLVPPLDGSAPSEK
jgi:hypothetical protein